jgi:hypothetical protein
MVRCVLFYLGVMVDSLTSCLCEPSLWTYSRRIYSSYFWFWRFYYYVPISTRRICLQLSILLIQIILLWLMQTLLT